MSDNTNLGDVAIETSFADYQDAGGLKLPSRLTTKTDNYTTAEIHVARQTVDADTGDLAAPAAAKAAPAIAGPAPATVTAEELAKGVWLLGGQSHHSVVVEFADHLTLIEAPQNDVRTLAVIAKARTLRPEKPLTQVVNTHHHFDHSGGIRAAVAEGLTIVTHKGNAAFYQSAVGRAHTIAPDALAKNTKPLKIETVGGALSDRGQQAFGYDADGVPSTGKDPRRSGPLQPRIGRAALRGEPAGGHQEEKPEGRSHRAAARRDCAVRGAGKSCCELTRAPVEREPFRRAPTDS